MCFVSCEVEFVDIKCFFVFLIYKIIFFGIDMEGFLDSYFGDVSVNKEVFQDCDILLIGVNIVFDSIQVSFSCIVVIIDCFYSSSGWFVQVFVSCSVLFGE